jgi:hypothetical protein
MARDVFDSYSRLAGWSAEIVRRMLVVIVGCGTLGSTLAEMLAAMGVGSARGGGIALLDHDFVEPHNRLRMSLVGPDAVGTAKVHAVADGLRRRFGDLARPIPLFGMAQTTLGAGLARRAACVFLCADNRLGRHRGCVVARAVGTPHLSGAIEGTLGMVCGLFDPPASACYECTLSAKERRELMPVRNLCSPEPAGPAPSVPTTPLAASITAAWMAQMMLRYADGERDGLLGQRLFINPQIHRVHAAQFRPRADCSCAGQMRAEAPVSLPASREEMTPRDLLREAAPVCGQHGAVALDYSLVTAAVCRRCGADGALDLPRHEADPPRCPACGEPMEAVAWTRMLDEAHPLADHTFAHLRLPPLHPVAVCGSAGMKTFELSGDARRLGLAGEAAP